MEYIIYCGKSEAYNIIVFYNILVLFTHKSILLILHVSYYTNIYNLFIK